MVAILGPSLLNIIWSSAGWAGGRRAPHSLPDPIGPRTDVRPPRGAIGAGDLHIIWRRAATDPAPAAGQHGLAVSLAIGESSLAFIGLGDPPSSRGARCELRFRPRERSRRGLVAILLPLRHVWVVLGATRSAPRSRTSSIRPQAPQPERDRSTHVTTRGDGLAGARARRRDTPLLASAD